MFDGITQRYLAEYRDGGKVISMTFTRAEAEELSARTEGTKLWLAAALAQPGRWVGLKDNTTDNGAPEMQKYLPKDTGSG